MEITARSLLAYVFAQAREMLDRSPEQVGGALGISGRTVRRLESADDEQRPRRSTLQTLAGYYGLDIGFVSSLAEWQGLQGADLAERLGELSDDEVSLDGVAMRAAALRLARGGSTRGMAVGGQLPPGLANSEDWTAMVEAFLSLNARQRRLLISLAQELSAQGA